jgi:competence protein ComEA
MKKVTGSHLIGMFKIMAFALLIAVSWPGMAQDIAKNTSELAAIEMERVNINNADAETIARVLVGVGLSRAEAIVTYREEYGNFTSLDELMLVNGIGEVTLRNNEARINFD